MELLDDYEEEKEIYEEEGEELNLEEVWLFIFISIFVQGIIYLLKVLI